MFINSKIKEGIILKKKFLTSKISSIIKFLMKEIHFCAILIHNQVKV